jgi:5-formyltetrahydrofolate cyclo-ligase
MTKKDIRLEVIKKRNLLNSEAVKHRSQNCVKIIKSYPGYQEANVVGLFNPIQNELNLLELCVDQNKTFCFPKVETTGLVFYEVNQFTQFKRSPFGVLEPQDAPECKTIDFMIVPALAISKDFYRIGYGKGYYDRYLKNRRSKHVIGVIYDFQEIESFEVDPHDQKLDDYIKV